MTPNKAQPFRRPLLLTLDIKSQKGWFPATDGYNMILYPSVAGNQPF